MEWFFGAFFALMMGLFIWASLPARRALNKKIQSLVDDLFDSKPRATQTSNRTNDSAQE